MKVRKLSNETAQRFVDEMIELIRKRETSIGVNLRDVAKKVGCAHTNAYNYFDGFDGLKQSALEQTLSIYEHHLKDGVDSMDSALDRFMKLCENYIQFGVVEPGLFRFVSSDPLDKEKVVLGVVDRIIHLKSYYLDLFYEVSQDHLTREVSDTKANIIMAYMDGETFNIVNERTLPGEQLEQRIISNVSELITLFLS